MSCTQVSTTTPSLVTLGGTAGLRCEEYTISGAPMSPARTTSFIARYPPS